MELCTTTSAIFSVICVKNICFHPTSFSDELSKEKHMYRFLGTKTLLMMCLKLFVIVDNYYCFGSGLKSQWTIYIYSNFPSGLTDACQSALAWYIRLPNLFLCLFMVLMCNNRCLVSPQADHQCWVPAAAAQLPNGWTLMSSDIL